MNVGGIYINDLAQYKANSNLIFRLIKKNYPDEHIIFEESQNIDLDTVQIGCKINLTIMPDSTWIEIKKNIDGKLYGLKNPNNICRLCQMNIKTKTECNKCKKSCCLECYIRNFKANNGIIKCDNCSYSFGVFTPDEYIDVLVGDIREKANQMNREKLSK
jgi:hypothetical protein